MVLNTKRRATGLKFISNTSTLEQCEPRSEKTGLRGFRPDPKQTGLYNHRRWLEA